MFDLHPLPPPTQLSLHILQLVSSMSALAFLTFASHPFQASMDSLKSYHHPYRLHVHTTSLHSLLPFYLMFPTNPAFPSTPHHSFYQLISLYALISPWLSLFFLTLPSQFPSNNMFHFHITLLIVLNYNKPSLSFAMKTFAHVTTFCIL